MQIANSVFLEGTITHDGQEQPFRGGLMKIIEAARRNGLEALAERGPRG